MKRFADKYVESIIKKTVRGTMSSRDAALKLGITKQYMNKLKARYLQEGIASGAAFSIYGWSSGDDFFMKKRQHISVDQPNA